MMHCIYAGFEILVGLLNDLQITAKLGSTVPVITNEPSGIIGRDAFSDEFKEVHSLLYLQILFLF